MKVERIVKKDEKNVTLFLDNNEKLFLSYEVFLKSGLRKNDDIPEDRISLLIDDNKKYFLKQKAFRYLGRRHHSSYEIKLKLKQKNYDSELIETIIEELEKGNYINDYEFAKIYSEENIRNKLWGKRKVEAELIKKGVERSIIARVVNECFPAENEIEKAITLCEKKLRTLRNIKIEDGKLIPKLISFLISRGYDYEISRTAAEKVFNNVNGDFS